MTNSQKIAVPLLLLAALGAGGYWFYVKSPAGGEITPQRAREEVPVAPPAQPQEPATPIASNTVATEPKQPERVAARPGGNAHEDAAQGVKGRVLLPNGMPAAEVPIYLIESMMNDPINVFLMSKSGKTLPPISSGTTATDGTFALGLYKNDKSYDLRIASDAHPEKSHASIKVREGDWFDTGDVQLENGLVITGRVIDEFSRNGIPDATVLLTSSNQAHTALPTPGRERGIVVQTDGTGAFQLANAPNNGLVNVTAEALGYASTTLINQQIHTDTPNVFTLEISRGQPIAGIAVDSAGEPLANIQITAQGLSQKTPQTATTTTISNGTFEFPCLREGPYQLTATSNAYNENKAPPVVTGEVDVKLVLMPRPWVKLRVRGAKNEAIKTCRISLKRHFPNNPLGIGNVPEFADRSLTLADYPREFGGEWAVVRGLPAGTFVFQIQDTTHAKSLSESFTVAESNEPVEVEAQLTMGAVITGTVVDDRGSPVAGATVSTDMNGALSGDGGFLDFLRAMIPERHSKAQARTNGKGHFRLEKLAFADYMIRVAHNDFCEGTSIDIKLAEDGQVLDVGTLRLSRGTIIDGFTTIGGHAGGQIKVSLTMPQPEPGLAHTDTPAQPAVAAPQAFFSGLAISDNDGRYRLLKRVPPGTYKVHAMRASGSNNPFEALMDIKETEKTITIAAGQDRMQIDFNLSAR